MPQLPHPFDGMSDFWHRHGYTVLVAGMALTLLVILATLVVAHKRKHLDRWVSTVTWIAVYGFSADGMWIVATQKAHLPPGLAAAVFFVGDAMMIHSMIRSRQRYTRTTVRDEASGTIITPGDPGKHGRAVWLIATVMGLIVAFSSHNPVEWALRLSLPLGAAFMWWNDLTADGVTAQKTTLLWTPRRLLIRYGVIAPGEDDLETVNERRQLDELTALALRTHGVVPVSDRRKKKARERLTTLLPAAVPGALEEVQRRVDIGHRAVELTAPGTRTVLDEAAAAVADVERRLAATTAAYTAEVDRIRSAAAKEVEAARQQAAAEARRRQSVAGEADQRVEHLRAELEESRTAMRRVQAAAAEDRQRRQEAEAERDAAVRTAAEAATARVQDRQRPAPAPATGGGTGNGARGPATAGNGTGRHWSETVARYRQAKSAQPDLNQVEYAALIGIKERALRIALQRYRDAREVDEAAAEAAVEKALAALSNGHEPVPAGVG
jgi:hypothetical protein